MDMLNLTANERLDLADLSYATFDSQVGLHRAITGQVLMDANGFAPAYILSGFAATNPAGTQVTVTRGVALLPYRTETQVLYGMVASEGPQSQTLDLSTRAAGTYTVYITFAYQPGAYDTRTLWASDNGGSEYASAVPTRKVAGWQMVIETANPGSEWLPIATVTTPGMAIVDMRPFFFEGRADQDFAPQWGSATDRAATRAANPVTNLQTFVQAMQQCLIDIKGPGIANWYTPYIAGQTIGYKGTAAAGQTSWLDANFSAQGDASVPSFNFSSDHAAFGYNRLKKYFYLIGGTTAGSTALTFTDPTQGTLLYTLQGNSQTFSLVDNQSKLAPVAYTPATQTLDLSGSDKNKLVLPPPSQVTYSAPQTVTQYLPIMSGVMALGTVFFGSPYTFPGASYTVLPNGGTAYTALTGVISLGLASGVASNAIGATYVLPLHLPGACTLTKIVLNHVVFATGQTGNILLMKKPNPATVTQTGTAATVVAKAYISTTQSTTLALEGIATYAMPLTLNEAVTPADVSNYFILINMYNTGSTTTAPTLNTSVLTIDHLSLTYTTTGPGYGANG